MEKTKPEPKQKPQMKRTDSRMIKLPALLVEIPGLSREQASEVNARSYDYCRRTAKPTLSEYVIKPFDAAFKENVFEKAKKEVGLDPEGIIKEKFSHAETVAGKKLVCTVSPSTRQSHENVLITADVLLRAILSDNLAGVRKDGVRKEDDGVYVLVSYLMNELEKLNGKHSTRFNKQDMSLMDPKTGRVLASDEEIEEMRVYLALRRYAQISPENVDSFHSARSLSRRIGFFMRGLEQELISQFGISPASESAAFDFELSDGSAMRYLFYPRQSTEYGKVFSRLVGKGTKSITATTGDLNILEELAFRDQYESSRNGSGVVVLTEKGKSGKGITKILRTSTDGSQEQVYHVLDSEGKVFVRAQDVLDAIETITQSYSSGSVQVKIDFFAALPEHLK